MHLFKSSLYEVFSSNYANELMGSYVTCISTMYYYMSICKITFLTSLKPKHGSASNSVWMFLWYTPTKLVKFRLLPPYKME